MKTFEAMIQELCEQEYKFVMKYREMFVAAFIAETGLKPSECEMVETRSPGMLGYKVTVSLRKKTTE